MHQNTNTEAVFTNANDDILQLAPSHTATETNQCLVSEIKAVVFTRLFVQISYDLSHVADTIYNSGVVFVALLRQRDQNIAAIPEESQNVKTANKAFMALRPSHVMGHICVVQPVDRLI